MANSEPTGEIGTTEKPSYEERYQEYQELRNRLYYKDLGDKRYTLISNPGSGSTKSFSAQTKNVIWSFVSLKNFEDYKASLQASLGTALTAVTDEFNKIDQQTQTKLAQMLFENTDEEHDQKALTLAYILQKLAPSDIHIYVAPKGKSSYPAQADEDNLTTIIPDVLCTLETLQTKALTRKRKRESTGTGAAKSAKKQKTEEKKSSGQEQAPVISNNNNNNNESITNEEGVPAEAIDEAKPLAPEIPLSEEQLWKENFTGYYEEKGNYAAARIYFDIKSNFKEEFQTAFKKYADLADRYYDLLYKKEEFKELVVVTTDLCGYFGINTIAKVGFKENIVLAALTEKSCYGKLQRVEPLDMLEVLHLLLWNLKNKIKANGEQQVKVFQQELGPKITIQLDPQSQVEATLMQPLKINDESAVLKVEYNGKICVLKIGAPAEIQNEISALQTIQAEGIPHTILTGKVMGYNCILLTFMEGSALSSLVRPMCSSDAATITQQLQDIISQVHSLGYVHNDVHPGNVLWNFAKKKVYLIDFGRSKKSHASNVCDDLIFLEAINTYLQSYESFQTIVDTKYCEEIEVN